MRSLLASFVLLVSCLSAAPSSQQSADARARSALSMLAAAIDPAYSIAMEGCAELEFAQLDLARRGILSTRQVDANLTPVRARCDAMRVVFDQIRRAHTRAAELVERGLLVDAEAEIESARRLWRALKDSADIPPLIDAGTQAVDAATRDGAATDGGSP